MNSKQPEARLLWNAENGKMELLIHKGDVVNIGRGDTNTIILNSARVSRNHARIEWSGEHLTLQDMNSSNGTFVNGERIELKPYVLRDGDLILLERVPMRIEMINSLVNEQDTYKPSTSSTDLPLESKPRLIIIEGAEIGREIIIGKESITIGRESQNATWVVRLKDGTVSRPHARIELLDGKHSLIDLGSANGTTVNDIFIIGPVTLNDGDAIGIGSTKLVFRLK